MVLPDTVIVNMCEDQYGNTLGPVICMYGMWSGDSQKWTNGTWSGEDEGTDDTVKLFKEVSFLGLEWLNYIFYFYYKPFLCWSTDPSLRGNPAPMGAAAQHRQEERKFLWFRKL